jgi:hypothetical protein
MRPHACWAQPRATRPHRSLRKENNTDGRRRSREIVVPQRVTKPRLRVVAVLGHGHLVGARIDCVQLFGRSRYGAPGRSHQQYCDRAAPLPGRFRTSVVFKSFTLLRTFSSVRPAGSVPWRWRKPPGSCARLTMRGRDRTPAPCRCAWN